MRVGLSAHEQAVGVGLATHEPAVRVGLSTREPGEWGCPHPLRSSIHTRTGRESGVVHTRAGRVGLSTPNKELNAVRVGLSTHEQAVSVGLSTHAPGEWGCPHPVRSLYPCEWVGPRTN